MPEAGDFVLVKMHGGVSAAIRIGQWLNGSGFADYEHVAIYDGNGGLWEATPKRGIMHNWLTEYESASLLWSTGIIPLTPDQRAAIVASAKRYKDVDYSFLDYFALAAHRLHIPAPDLKRYIRTSHHMICSQFVDRCYLDAGYHLFNDNRWEGYVTPGDLYQLLTPTVTEALPFLPLLQFVSGSAAQRLRLA
jgi:hypothetical protein